LSVIQHCATRYPDLVYTLDRLSLPNNYILDSSVKRTEFHWSEVQFICSRTNLSRFSRCSPVSFGPVAALLGIMPTSLSLLLTVHMHISYLCELLLQLNTVQTTVSS
ncbi:hypothetical protein WDU94_005710, partial [Cyamophila willieti]